MDPVSDARSLTVARGPRGALLCLVAALGAGAVAVLTSCASEPERPAGEDATVARATHERSAAEERAAFLTVERGAGARRMAARLRDIIGGLDPVQNQFLNAERAAFLRKAIERSRIPAQRIMLTTNLADELLKQGEVEEAIALTEPFLGPGGTGGVPGPPAEVVREFLAMAYLRLGETENCLVRHREHACLLPIRGDGVHTRQRGSRAAIEHLTAILEDRPDDPGAMWLLNIAHMTLGEYPDGVPERWRIPPERFAAEYEVKRFRNVAPAIGLTIRGEAGGGIMEDFDGDGLLDLMVSSMGVRDQMRLFHNNGDGTFEERTEAAGLEGELGGLNMVHADYDNNGYPDVLVLRGGWMRSGGRFPNSLLRNNGDGTFEDVTEEAGLLNFRPTQTAAWADYDNDGWLDLFIGNETMEGDPHPSALYHNNGDGTFTDRSINLGDTALGYVKAVVWGDFNNDGRQDLFVSVLDGDNLLFRNDGPRNERGPGGEDWRFTEVAREAGVVGPRNSFPSWFWDYDNDGWLDLFVAGYKTLQWEKPCRLTDCVGRAAAMYMGRPQRMEVPRLYHNDGDGTFSDVTRRTRLDRVVLPMGSNLGDLDNDGWPDAYFGTGEPNLATLIPNQLFRNDRGRTFQDVTVSADVGHLQKGHGVAFGDIDNDGDQDLFAEMGGFFGSDAAYSVLFENPGHGNHWVTLRLVGRRSNRSAIGARIRVRVREPGGSRDIYATVGTGGSFGGNSLQQEIGLGAAAAIAHIEVTWPASGVRQVFRDVAMDRAYRVVETATELEPLEVTRFRFPAGR
ncbi:MAG: FG-GAP-like repeat-containing protein [Acidobacteriota bacterium]